LIESIVLSLYLVVLWLFSQPFFFSLLDELQKKLQNPLLKI